MWSSFFGSSEAKEKFSGDATFTINEKSYKVGGNTPKDMTLNTYIREVAHLPGTKFMCQEGGCGVCVVAATVTHPISKEKKTFAVNSCLIPVLACHDWAITTIEGVGSKRNGYHHVQAQLAHFNGTQCGFCSPGMVMNMYSLLEQKTPTMAEIENSFGGNICRCTGYRPILDAFKSLGTDASPELKKACVDIEDIYKLCPKSGKQCSGQCSEENNKEESIPIRIISEESKWYKVTSVSELFSIFDEIGDASYRLIAGNTAQGVYRINNSPQVYIDIKDVVELRTINTSPSLSLGGNVTLTEALELFAETALPCYAYLKQVADHIDQIANVPVRNIGTLAGNLFTKYDHHEFPSDIFTLFETIGATLNIMESPSNVTNVSLTTFLNLNMKKKIILNIEIPSLDTTYHFKSFKITPRAQNAHAYVNAGFLVKVADTTDWTVTEKPRIVFGGISPDFIHASKLETYLIGKKLMEPATLTNALPSLEEELSPDAVLPDASPEFRKYLAQALFYKFLLHLAPSKVASLNRSGGESLVRPLSSGKQDFDTDKSQWPLNQPIPKIEALHQCSGEAEFVNDIPSIPDELHGAFVLAKISQGKISKIDPSPALAVSGVVAFYSHTDIPGDNTFTPLTHRFLEKEEVFCSGDVKYAGQIIGMLVAETRQIAVQAAKLVVVEYDNVQTPLVNMQEILKSTGARVKNHDIKADLNGEKVVNTPAHVIKGEFEIGKQFHFTMEPQTCLCVPKEDGLDIFSSTQWMEVVQMVIANALQIPANSVNMNVRRLGGGYGAKISRPSQIAVACSLASSKLNRAVRVVMTLEDNMEVAGKRFGLRHEYEVGVDDVGKIEYLKSNLIQDSGCNFNESPLQETLHFMKNCYKSENFSLNGKEVRTDTASNTWCRAPGTLEGISFMEEVMEHISKVVKKDPLEVRMVNMDTENSPLPELIEDLKQKADYETRKHAVEEFNSANRWIKKGISIVVMKYPFAFWGNFSALVSIYQGDGTVSISHGGIEMGQGINTKVAQVCAHILGISLSKVAVKPSNNLTSPNGTVTGGSIGSEACAYAVMTACQELLKRLQPVKAKMPNAPWEMIVRKAYSEGVDLCATYMFTAKDNVKNYDICGVTIAEVEVDILTGSKQVLRVDLLEDVGQSLSPYIDVGQVEGAFVMGMGYWLSEELTYDPQSGRLLNNRTWNYKPPGAKDIPIDFRVYFRKNAPNLTGVLRSKATGEPPLNMSIVVLFALRNAVDSARKDAHEPDEWFQMKTPATPENVFLMTNNKTSYFSF